MFRDPTAKILIIGDEDRLPYMRPPLSKVNYFCLNVILDSQQFPLKLCQVKSESDINVLIFKTRYFLL